MLCLQENKMQVFQSKKKKLYSRNKSVLTDIAAVLFPFLYFWDRPGDGY
jgi:hypothetical protein